MKYRTPILGLTGLLALLAFWQIGSLILAQSMPLANMLTPAAALGSLAHLLPEAALWAHIGASLQRVAVGLMGALAAGIPIGFALGLSRRAEETVSPAFQFLRMVSPLSWMPVAVMLFGIGNAPIYFLLAFAAVWPIILNTASGVRNNGWNSGARSRQRARRCCSKSCCPPCWATFSTACGWRLAFRGWCWCPAKCSA